MTSPWTDFVIEAQKIYPAFKDENLIKAVLKDRGTTIFKSQNSNEMLKDLKDMVNGWQLFLKDAREIDSEKFKSDGKVAKILNSYGIPWYKNFEYSEGIKALKDWMDKQKFTCSGWDYPCPVCGAPTRRDSRWDFMYRKECHGLGWTCTAGGSKHFHSAAWAHLKPMFVESESEKLSKEVTENTDEPVISQP